MDRRSDDRHDAALEPNESQLSRQGQSPSGDWAYTRNVVVIDARVEEMPVGEDVELEDAYIRATDFDPRPWNAGYTFFRLIPERIQAWRGDDADELRDKDLMRDGVFI